MSTKAVEQLVSTVRAARAICETSAIGPKALHESENMYERLLRFAIQGNQFDKISIILAEYKSRPDFDQRVLDESLYFASYYGFPDVVRVLVEGGAALTYASPAGNTALMKAVGSRNADSVRVLLELKADPSIVTKSGLSALEIAECIQDPLMVEILRVFREFVLSTRTEYIRSIFFSTDFSVISLIRLVTRGARVQEDIDSIVHNLRSSKDPCWFLVRGSMEETDTEWTLGYCGDESVSIKAFGETVKKWFDNANFVIHSRNFSEQSIWNHLFPHYSFFIEDTLIIVLDNTVDPPVFQFGTLSVERHCQTGSCCYVVTHTGSSLTVQLMNPYEGDKCMHCFEQRSPTLAVHSAIYAFMKRELGEYLGPIFPNSKITLLPDINNCGELHSGSSRRRSTAEVLSPPTLGKYNQGESKRSRQFTKSPQPLFSN